ncbi:MAG: murein L,D-transpeptidase [Micropruina sp.]|nr:MAG: murein L,D-transpeptidase [Micropruina sp.]
MRNPTIRRRTTGSLAAATAATLALVLAGCAAVPPPQVAAGPTPSSLVPVSASPSAVASTPSLATSAPVSQSASPKATPTPTPTQTKPTISPAAKKVYGSCLNKTINFWARGACVTLVQKQLRKLKFYSGPVNGTYGVSTINALINYQRSRGIRGTGVVAKLTWTALATKQPALPKVLPKQCLTKGVVLCVDEAHRRLTYLKSGKVIKEIKIRVGGFNSHPKTKQWRVFPTANGTWKVYNKMVSPPSENYGPGAMPYSVMFYPDMYVHYSPDFHRWGYSRSSHGCVNVGSLKDAIWFFKNTPIGAKVYTFGM